MMKEWYAAKVIMYVRFLDGNQNKYPVWENINLIRAASPEEALKKAEKCGRDNKCGSDGSHFREDRLAEWLFGGVRQVIPLRSLNPAMPRIVHGTRISYSEFKLANKEDFQNFIDNKDVMVKCLETNVPATWHIDNHPGGIKDRSVRKWEWLAPSVIMLVKFKDGIQDKYMVRENVFLIKASPTEDPYEVAEEIGRKEESDCGGTFTWEGRPAEWVCVGVRKIITVFTLSIQENRLSDGSEPTYSRFELFSEEDFRKLVNGKSAGLLYEEEPCNG